ncbi:MAG TPA: aminodeoxychorismate synthase component I, partial [Gemmatimonadaceae bacterium]|nr:aminodeoxychorismate synthase component I [Gemmatimonadaceae bacterium]
ERVSRGGAWDGPLVEELLPLPDPLACCERLARLPYRLLLDSAAAPSRLGRYSFLAADPPMLVWSKGTHTERITLASGSRERLSMDALSAVRDVLARHATPPIPGLPPFQGGAAGYLGYDWGAVLERLPAPRHDDLAIPDVMLGIYDWVVAWDHEAGRAWIISTGLPHTGAVGRRRAAERLAFVRRALATPASADDEDARVSFPALPPQPGSRAPSYPVPGVELAEELELRSSFTHAGYLDAVRRAREYIVAGDIFQVNVSQRLEAPLAEPPWRLYRRLRRLNPAPFAAYLDFHGVTIASASPERFVKVSDERLVETRPIKGTRPRGVGPEHDAALGLALYESVKDRAENLMIVDLLRNDLSRVCQAGSVRVSELFALERYATVHHLVSAVVGELAPEADAVDLLQAAFPGGSITGAPKVRAMEIIAELEPSRRGVYCGAIGYLSVTGAMDTSIVIRTILALRDRAYFSVGGGIVFDSDPEEEYRETLDKGRALIAALAGGRRTAGGVAG